jgi:uncharacterized membrane protein
MKSEFEQYEQDRMINDPKNYKWGVFYYNPMDSRFILPKRYRWMGWTLNFANIYSYVFILGTIIIVVLLGTLGK